jgi:adenosylmethionine-8-amino-7-oxononanoate aminotransferase
LAPPLCITRDEVDHLVRVVTESLHELNTELAR